MGTDLKFVPRGNTLVPVPGIRTHHGEQPRRVCASVKGNKWQVSPRPHGVKPGSKDAILFIRLCQKGGVAAYDQFTADACGVQFEPLEWRDGDQGWLPATQPKPVVSARPSRRSTSHSED